MLREINHVRQIPNDYFRRIFRDKEAALYVWYKPSGLFYGFQFCRALDRETQVLTWREDRGFSQDCLDDGETNPCKNHAPMLVPGGPFDAARILADFLSVDGDLPRSIRDFVRRKIETFTAKA